MAGSPLPSLRAQQSNPGFLQQPEKDEGADESRYVSAMREYPPESP
jgi:hypothetical protein